LTTKFIFQREKLGGVVPDSAVSEPPRGRRAKLTPADKRQIALGYVQGKSSAEIGQEFNLSERGFYRLRQEDEAFQAAVDEFTAEVRVHLRTLLQNHAAEALKTLAGVLQVDERNFVEAEGPNGGRVTTRRIDNKILAEKRMAAAQLVEFWMKLSATDEDRRRWELANMTPLEDEEEDEDD
jgi:hypothetical protein